MQTEISRRRCATAGVFASLFVAAALAAGEGIPPPPPPPVTPGQPPVPGQPVEKPVVSNPLDENYVIDDNGRRDPFTYTKAVVNLDSFENKGTDETKPPDILPKEVVEKKRVNGELALNQAESSLMDLDPNNAIVQCDRGMEEFKDVPDITKYPELEVVKGRILRARKASDQMRNRQTAERDFTSMNIKINGVMYHPKNAQAIINSKIVHKGDLVPVTGDQTDVMIDEIRPDHVVFLFRNYRMTLLVSEAGGK